MKGDNLVGLKKVFLFCVIILAFSCEQNQEQEKIVSGHKSMVFAAGSIDEIQLNRDAYPLFSSTLENAIAEVDAEILEEMDVPVPKDLAGGYTHNKHKRNYTMMQKAGKLYVITKDEKYAEYIETMLLKYAELFPTLGLHPAKKSYTRGKLFWQCLNDANWLVYASQAYDCIYDYMSPEKRNLVEKNLFRPYADFLSIETPHFFNRIHNHSTWACAGVGMVGLVLNDSVLVNRALYGLADDGLSGDAIDNDGGLIKSEEKAGFLAQMDLLFSPDGFYAEGPYYQRYAMYPFVVFASSLENVKPEIKIFEYRDGIIGKSVGALLNLTDDLGQFYPINDAQKGMSYYSKELVSAVDIAYKYVDADPQFLSIVEKQDRVLLDAAGFTVAKAVAENKTVHFEPKSMQLRDGADGDRGGVGILRSKRNGASINVVFKYNAQGMGHGHFDKLSFAMYKNGQEVLQDYGVARFVNIEQKDGGGYLKENKTYAKQTIAHNTLVVNKASNFEGKTKKANDYYSEAYLFDATKENIHVASAVDNHAYEGVNMQRTVAVITEDVFSAPVVLDIMKVRSDNENEYDLPYHYFGQIMSVNCEIEIPEVLEPMGEKQGYQHIWNEGVGSDLGAMTQFTWLNDDQFYTLSSNTVSSDQLLFGRVGANDPNFNLRSDPLIALNRKAKNTLFVSTIESHGDYSRVSELSSGAFSEIKKVEVLVDQNDYTVVRIESQAGTKMIFGIANADSAADTTHTVQVGTEEVTWKGPIYYKTLKK